MLHVAAGRGLVALVQQLFVFVGHEAAAALLPYVNSKSVTALHRAARAGRPKMVALLIRLAQEHGPGAALLLGRKNSAGDTALHVAARHGREAVVQVLMVAAPALSSTVNDAGLSPLYLAVMSRSVDAVKALVQWRHASASGYKGQNALHAAVLHSAGEPFDQQKSPVQKNCRRRKCSANLWACTEITAQLLSWTENQNLAKETDESGSSAS